MLLLITEKKVKRPPQGLINISIITWISTQLKNEGPEGASITVWSTEKDQVEFKSWMGRLDGISINRYTAALTPYFPDQLIPEDKWISAHQGTVARDVLPLVFYIYQPRMSPWFFSQIIIFELGS